MTFELNDFTIIANALYSKRVNSLRYTEIENYKILLYKMLVEKYKFIFFNSTESNIIEINNHTFIKLADEVICYENIVEDFIEKLNSIYPDEFKEIIDQLRIKYKKVDIYLLFIMYDIIIVGVIIWYIYMKRFVKLKIINMVYEK